jgi:hypothetical protein
MIAAFAFPAAVREEGNDSQQQCFCGCRSARTVSTKSRIARLPELPLSAARRATRPAPVHPGRRRSIAEARFATIQAGLRPASQIRDQTEFRQRSRRNRDRSRGRMDGVIAMSRTSARPPRRRWTTCTESLQHFVSGSAETARSRGAAPSMCRSRSGTQ